MMELRRGEVYIANLPEKKDSNIQGGIRPIVIMSNDKNNTYCSNIQYVPLTSQIKRMDLPVHVEINVNFLPKPSMALCEQVDMESKKIVSSYIDWNIGCIGRLSNVDMMRISYGTAVQLGYAFMINPSMINTNQYAMA